MDAKTALVLVGLNAAMSTTTTQAAELENRHVSKLAAYESIAQHTPRELTYEEMDRVTAGLDPVTMTLVTIGGVQLSVAVGSFLWNLGVFCSASPGACTGAGQAALKQLVDQIGRLGREQQDLLKNVPISKELSREMQDTLAQLQIKNAATGKSKLIPSLPAPPNTTPTPIQSPSIPWSYTLGGQPPAR